MTRNTPEILPYCQHCGNYKGVGTCSNPLCDKSKWVDISSLHNKSGKCMVCTQEGDTSCFRCGSLYCINHAVGWKENRLQRIDQRLGTCVVCGAVICEQCWIFNNKGLVTCRMHHETNFNSHI
jgi:hypothetical protein